VAGGHDTVEQDESGCVVREVLSARDTPLRGMLKTLGVLPCDYRSLLCICPAAKRGEAG